MSVLELNVASARTVSPSKGKFTRKVFSTILLGLIPELLRDGKLNYRPWHKLLPELDKRGWRLRLRGRQVLVLRKRQEEPRADAEFRY